MKRTHLLMLLAALMVLGAVLKLGAAPMGARPLYVLPFVPRNDGRVIVRPALTKAEEAGEVVRMLLRMLPPPAPILPTTGNSFSLSA